MSFKPKKMGVLTVLLGLSFACSGCSARLKMQTKFDYSEHEPYAKTGENGISGQALLTQQGGSVVTCAGSRVLLLPATSYFREVFWHMIVGGSDPEPPARPYPSLKNMIRRAECDAQGNFSFSEIPDGTWFVLTQVNGGHANVLITEVTLSNGGTTRILLSENHVVGR